MGYAETIVLRLPDNYNQAALDALAQRPPNRMRAPPESRRSLPVAPLIGDQRCYGEAMGRLRGDYGGLSAGNGPGGWCRVKGQRLAFGGEPTGAGGINRESGKRQRSQADAQPGPGFHR